jgi:aminoglycoside phosphotransferase (APT) family kinase protein
MRPDDTSILESIAHSIPGFDVKSVELEGEGDFCRAYTVNDVWLFRFARNSEGSLSLGREAVLLPVLARNVLLPIPNPVFSGHELVTGFAFTGHRKIPGIALTRENLNALGLPGQAECARVIAGFLDDLHSFDVEQARPLGVPESDYPFARTEEGLKQGDAAAIYRAEAERLASYPELDAGTRLYCTRLAQQLAGSTSGSIIHSLVHGDLSQEHILHNPETSHVTGIIDFSDAMITTPLLDYVYLYRSYGSAFFSRVLGHLRPADVEGTESQVRLLHQWYLAIRLLWTLDHGYRPGIEPRLRELNEAR